MINEKIHVHNKLWICKKISLFKTFCFIKHLDRKWFENILIDLFINY